LNTKKKDFDQILLDSIDEALGILSESVKTSIYFHLWDKFEIKKQDIPDKLDEFSDALESIFGIGARQLEILFMKSLYSKISLEFKSPNDFKLVIPDLTFVEYTSLIKQKFQETTVSEKLEVFLDEGEEQEQYY
jgi:hypothetical protein